MPLANTWEFQTAEGVVVWWGVEDYFFGPRGMDPSIFEKLIVKFSNVIP